MPEISRFYGIVIRMYGLDHAPPHVTAVHDKTHCKRRGAGIGASRSSGQDRLARRDAAEMVFERRTNLQEAWRAVRLEAKTAPLAGQWREQRAEAETAARRSMDEPGGTMLGHGVSDGFRNGLTRGTLSRSPPDSAAPWPNAVKFIRDGDWASSRPRTKAATHTDGFPDLEHRSERRTS